MLIKPFALIFQKVFLCLIISIRPVSEDSIIASQGNRASCALVGSVRVLLQERIQARNHVEIADIFTAVGFYIVAFYITVFVDHKLVREAGRFIRMIIAQVIDRKNDRFFSRREHQALVRCKVNRSVCISCLGDKIVEADVNISIIVELLGDLVKFVYGSHPGVHTIGLCLAECGCVESSTWVIDKRMIENMWNGRYIDCNTG